MEIYEIIKSLLESKRLTLHKEKNLQEELHSIFIEANLLIKREYRLDNHNIIDFYAPYPQIGIEVKVKGNPSSINDQLERYASFKKVNGIILITNKSYNFPKKLKNKPIKVITLGVAYL